MAKNATFLLKPDVLRLGEGHVSSIWMLFLRLGELEAHFLINASFALVNDCFALANPM